MHGAGSIASHRIDLGDATSGDAAALAALNVASWRAAYAHILPEAYLGGSGFSRVSLWVFTRNAKARRFYEQRGWRLEPNRWFRQQDGLRRQLVCYSRPLSAP